MVTASPGLAPRRLAPFFILVALIEVAAVATRFDLIAAKLPVGAASGVMLAVVPLLVLAGYFEGRLSYGDALKSLPLWMRIKSVPVKLAFTFGFIYLACVALQTFNISLGPVSPSPPVSFPAPQRALWFAMFTAGMFFPFYLAAAGLLIPVLRVLTAPLRALPGWPGALLALVLGGGLGVVVLAAVTSSSLRTFVREAVAAYRANPALGLAVTLASTFVPLVVGALAARVREPLVTRDRTARDDSGLSGFGD